MALPTPTALAAAAQALVPHAAAQLTILGFPIDASEIETIVTVAVDAMCMKAWKAAQATGQAAADAITTEDAAEAAQRQP